MADDQLNLVGSEQRGSEPRRARVVKGKEPPKVSNPLDELQAASLLDPVDVVRDPLHGDIWLTALERCLTDSPEFQRLRGINQLGMTYIAYPGAVHNRFLHSLGTLHVCGEMIRTCNENASTYSRLARRDEPAPVRLTSYQMLLARLCALLHDLAHVPFGHTLEKEGAVFEKDEWQDSERVAWLFGEDSGLTKRLREFFRIASLPDGAADQVRTEIRDILTTRGGDIEKLRYPFVHDLVGNTICADLIDYVQRDMYFCGLTERFGDRFLEYLAVVPLTRKPEAKGAEGTYHPIVAYRGDAFPTQADGADLRCCRVVLLRYRYNERNEAVVKQGVIAEAVDLIRRRLALAEKVYFHRTKIIGSSMLISAVHEAGLKMARLWVLTDHEVLKDLEASTNERAKALGAKLRSRKLFKPIYRASYHGHDASHASALLWDEQRGAYQRYRQPANRQKLERRLERLLGLLEGKEAAGSVTVYCPDAKMNLKGFEMLVLRRPRFEPVTRLAESEHPPTKAEISAVHSMHQDLWRLEVFVDPGVISVEPQNPVAQRLAGAIQREIGPKNEVEGLGDASAPSLDEWERELLLKQQLAQLGVGHEIRQPDYEELMAMGSRVGDEEQRRAQVVELLRSKGYRV